MKIAIKGHLKRGKDVVQILESLGGINRMNHTGCYDEYFYYISVDSNTIAWTSVRPIHLSVFTLEEFEKEFPFKIGDRVISVTTNFIGTITDLEEGGCYYIKYDNGNSAYAFRQNLKFYKEMKEERNVTLTFDKAKEWYQKGGELKEIALQAFSEEELNPLPRSWEEYCKQGNPVASWRYDIPIKYEALFKLEQLRDCWIQSWVQTSTDPGYRICKALTGSYTVLSVGTIKYFLSFPNREMAEEFLKCFRDLIEKAGDLI